MADMSHEGRPSAKERNLAICVATYRRPRQLKVLLASLSRVALAETSANIEVLIVDNDVNESARHICEAAVLPWPLRYFVEPRRGIAQARNATIRHSASADWIVFVDDDELVEPQWLDCLLQTQLKFQADIVTGPVLPQFQPGVPDWIIQSRLFERHRYPTGSPPKTPGTGNVCFSAEVFRRIGLFDERFGFTGGEDSEFFLRASHAGLKVVWCDDAVVHEFIGSQRARLGYLLRREYQDASSAARAEMICSPGILTHARRGFAATIRMSQGILALPLVWMLGLPATARALTRICMGLGMLGGLIGITVEPYRSPESEL